MGCSGDIKIKSNKNKSSNMPNDVNDMIKRPPKKPEDADEVIDTNQYNEDDYPIFQSGWSERDIQNLRLIAILIVNKGFILIEKIFITIDHSKNITKFVKIETEIKGKNKNNHLIQKIYNKKCPFEQFKEYMDGYELDCGINAYYKTLSENPTTDNFIISQNIQGKFKTYQYIYYKDTYQCRFEDVEGGMDGQMGSQPDDPIEKSPENIVEIYNKKISEFLNYEKEILELKDPDKDIDTTDYEDYDYPIFSPFWHNNFIHSLKLLMMKTSKDGTINLDRIYITIDYSQNKTKVLKMQSEIKDGKENKHLVQKIYKDKCSFEKFKSDLEKYQSDFQILVKGMFSYPPSIDIYIISENNKGAIKRNAYLYDKENRICNIHTLEGENGNFSSTFSSEEKQFREMYQKYKEETQDITFLALDAIEVKEAEEKGEEQGDEGMDNDD